MKQKNIYEKSIQINFFYRKCFQLKKIGSIAVDKKLISGKQFFDFTHPLFGHIIAMLPVGFQLFDIFLKTF